jgi:sulfite reductase alpha subunit-like flavoprotein
LIGTTVNDISPIRALLQERWHQKYHENRQVGKVILYFWCKHPDLDKFYEDELLKFHEEHLVTHMHADFIREADHMVYVDHFLSKHGYDAWDLIDRQQASVFVCGDATAGLKVEKAFLKIAAEIGGKGTDNVQLHCIPGWTPTEQGLISECKGRVYESLK